MNEADFATAIAELEAQVRRLEAHEIELYWHIHAIHAQFHRIQCAHDTTPACDDERGGQ